MLIRQPLFYALILKNVQQVQSTYENWFDAPLCMITYVESNRPPQPLTPEYNGDRASH